MENKKPSNKNEVALPLLHQALTAGDALAAVILAENLIEENGSYAHSFSKEKAEPIVEWYEKAVEMGAPRAAAMLGSFYFRLHEPGPDAEENALKWLKLGAEGGDPQAQYELGRLLAAGAFVDLDWTAAEMWLSHAANGGIKAAHKGLEYLAMMRDPARRQEVFKMNEQGGYPPPRIPKED